MTVRRARKAIALPKAIWGPTRRIGPRTYFLDWVTNGKKEAKIVARIARVQAKSARIIELKTKRRNPSPRRGERAGRFAIYVWGIKPPTKRDVRAAFKRGRGI